MCTGVEIAIVGSALLGAGAAAYSGKQAANAQDKATKQAEKAAAATASQAEQEFNKANAKKPDIGAITSANQQAAAGGAGSTMLTGAMGVDPTSLSLGKTTLLGGQ